MNTKQIFITLIITVLLPLHYSQKVSAQNDDIDKIIIQLEAEINRLKDILSEKQLEPLNNILESLKGQKVKTSWVADKQKKIESAKLELKEAEEELFRACVEAKKAYDELKKTKGTEIFQSMESAVTEAEIVAGEHLLTEVGKIAAEREIGMKLGIEAGKKASTFVGFLGAAKTYFDIGEWLAKDTVLISRNIKSNWLTITKVWPARRRYDKAKEKLARLEEQPATMQLATEPENVLDVVGKYNGNIIWKDLKKGRTVSGGSIKLQITHRNGYEYEIFLEYYSKASWGGWCRAIATRKGNVLVATEFQGMTKWLKVLPPGKFHNSGGPNYENKRVNIKIENVNTIAGDFEDWYGGEARVKGSNERYHAHFLVKFNATKE